MLMTSDGHRLNVTSAVTSDDTMSPVPDAMAEFLEDLVACMSTRDRQTRRRQSQLMEIDDLECISHQDRYEKNMADVFNYVIMKYYIEHRIAQDALMDMMLAERNRKKKPRVIYYSN